MPTLNVSLLNHTENPITKLCAEVVTEGSMWDEETGGDFSWYVDAAHLELADGTFIRDLHETEIQILDDDKNSAFTEAVNKAYHEWAENYDPTE